MQTILPYVARILKDELIVEVQNIPTLSLQKAQFFLNAFKLCRQSGNDPALDWFEGQMWEALGDSTLKKDNFFLFQNRIKPTSKKFLLDPLAVLPFKGEMPENVLSAGDCFMLAQQAFERAAVSKEKSVISSLQARAFYSLGVLHEKDVLPFIQEANKQKLDSNKLAFQHYQQAADLAYFPATIRVTSLLFTGKGGGSSPLQAQSIVNWLPQVLSQNKNLAGTNELYADCLLLRGILLMDQAARKSMFPRFFTGDNEKDIAAMDKRLKSPRPLNLATATDLNFDN